MRIYSSNLIPSQETRLSVTWTVNPNAEDKTVRPADLTYGTGYWGSLQAALLEAAKYPLTKIDIVINEGVLEEDITVGQANLSHVTLRGINTFEPPPETTRAQLIAGGKSVIKGNFNLFECNLPKIQDLLFNSDNKEVTLSRCTSDHSQNLIVYSDFDGDTVVDKFALNIRGSFINVYRLMIFAKKGLKVFDNAILNVSSVIKIDCTPEIVPETYDSDVALLVETGSSMGSVAVEKIINSGSIVVRESSSLIMNSRGNLFINNSAITGNSEGIRVETNSAFSSLDGVRIRIIDTTVPTIVSTSSRLRTIDLRVETLKDIEIDKAVQVLSNSSLEITGILQLASKLPNVAFYLDRSTAEIKLGLGTRRIETDGEIIIEAVNGSILAIKDELEVREFSPTIEVIYKPAIDTIDNNNNHIISL